MLRTALLIAAVSAATLGLISTAPAAPAPRFTPAQIEVSMPSHYSIVPVALEAPADTVEVAGLRSKFREFVERIARCVSRSGKNCD